MKENEYKNLENQGWDAMFQTLDREMPVKKKRRGILWFFFFVGFATIGTGIWYLYAQPKTPASQSANAQPIAQNDMSISKSIFIQSDKNMVRETPNSDNNTGNGTSNSEKDINATNTESVKPLAHSEINESKIYSKTTNYNQINTSTEFTENNEQAVLLSRNTKIGENTPQLYPTLTRLDVASNQETNISTDIAHNSNNEKFKKYTELEVASLLKMPPLSITRDTDLTIALKPIILTPNILNNKKNKLEWGITAGLHSEKGQNLDGYQAGFVAQKPLSRRWVITTGLNFRQTKTIGDSTTFYKIEALSFASTATSNLQDSRAISLNKLYYLEMPLMLRYKINKHFALETGIKGAYLLDLSTKTSNSSVYWVKNATTNNSSSQLLDKINAQTLGLNRWDAAWINSVTYLPSKHVQLSLRYDLGMFNILNLNKWAAYNRYLGLNLTYLF